MRGVVGVMEFQNLKDFGVTSSSIKNVQTSINGDKMKITIDFYTQRLVSSGEYKFDFVYFGFPVKTNGSYDHTLTDSKTKIILDGRLENLDGEDYMKMYRCEVSLNPGVMEVHLTGIFQGLVS